MWKTLDTWYSVRQALENGSAIPNGRCMAYGYERLDTPSVPTHDWEIGEVYLAYLAVEVAIGSAAHDCGVSADYAAAVVENVCIGLGPYERESLPLPISGNTAARVRSAVLRRLRS